jgi:hypothetical protein
MYQTHYATVGKCFISSILSDWARIYRYVQLPIFHGLHNVFKASLT